MNYYEYNCARCGGLVPEPNKPYGYAGQWCHCAEPVRPSGQTISVTTSGANPIKDTPQSNTDWRERVLEEMRAGRHPYKTYTEENWLLDQFLEAERKRLREEVEQEQRKYSNGEDDYCHGAWKALDAVLQKLS